MIPHYLGAGLGLRELLGDTSFSFLDLPFLAAAAAGLGLGELLGNTSFSFLDLLFLVT